MLVTQLLTSFCGILSSYYYVKDISMCVSETKHSEKLNLFPSGCILNVKFFSSKLNATMVYIFFN